MLYNFTLYHREVNANLLDPRKVVQGAYIGLSGEIVSANDFAFSQFIPVSELTQYAGVSGDSEVFIRIAYYNSVKTFISATYVPGWTNTFTTPADCEFVIVCFGSITDNQDPNDMCLSVGATATHVNYYQSKTVQPSYDKVTREYEQESDEQYYREEFNATLSLSRGDYAYLNALPFDTKIYVDAEHKEGVFNLYQGQIYKTDCDWDDDNEIVRFSLTPADQYEEFLAGLEKRFNLIDLAPELEAVNFKRRSLTQVYIIGDDVVTNIIGGIYWEQNINIDPVTDDAELTGTYKFVNSKNVGHIAASYASGLSVDVTGSYDDSLVSENGLYRVIEVPSAGDFIYHIERISDLTFLYSTDVVSRLDGAEFSTSPGSGTTGTFTFTEYNIYTRLYTDLNEIDGSPTFSVPVGDIVQNTSNYSRVMPYDVDDFGVYDSFTAAPTRFGKAPEDSANAGEYYREYLVDSSTGLSNPLPVSSTNWKAVGLWFFNTQTTREFDFENTKDIQLRDAFPLHSVIQRLLLATGSRLTHVNTEDYSQVLYGAVNPFGFFTYIDFDGTGLATTSAGNIFHFLTPKSNIVTGGEYDQPARRADITLGELLKMLQDVYRIFWHIEGDKLILEHAKYYDQGSTYSTPVVGTDLTGLIQPRNGKKWEFGRNKYTFDKEQMPERFEFKWMDEVSTVFEGSPILINSGYVQNGKIEDRSAGRFTTDIDFVMANPTDISKDGFCLLGAVAYDSGYSVPLLEYDSGENQKSIIQNGFLSFPYLQPKFHVYDLPSDNVNINGEDDVLTNNNTRKKIQEVNYPIGSSVNPYELIKTSIGDGKIKKISIDSSSLIAKATIHHDTE